MSVFNSNMKVFPDGPVVRTCLPMGMRGHGVQSLVRELRSHTPRGNKAHARRPPNLRAPGLARCS